MTQGNKEFLATFCNKDDHSVRKYLGLIAEDAQQAWKKAQSIKRADEELMSVRTVKRPR